MVSPRNNFTLSRRRSSATLEVQVLKSAPMSRELAVEQNVCDSGLCTDVLLRCLDVGATCCFLQCKAMHFDYWGLIVVVAFARSLQ